LVFNIFIHIQTIKNCSHNESSFLLPLESTLYLADSKNAPYGNKSEEQIKQLCIKNTEKLIALGAKIIVIA